MNIEKEIEEWFFNLYNQCYTLKFRNIYSKNNIKYYSDKDYILKEKLYRITGKINRKKHIMNLMLYL